MVRTILRMVHQWPPHGSRRPSPQGQTDPRACLLLLHTAVAAALLVTVSSFWCCALPLVQVRAWFECASGTQCQAGVETAAAAECQTRRAAQPQHVPLRPPAAPRARLMPRVAPPVRVARSSDRLWRKPWPKPGPPPGSGELTLPRSGYFPRPRPRPPRRAMPKPRMAWRGGNCLAAPPPLTRLSPRRWASRGASPWPPSPSPCRQLAGMGL